MTTSTRTEPADFAPVLHHPPDRADRCSVCGTSSAESLARAESAPTPASVDVPTGEELKLAILGYATTPDGDPIGETYEYGQICLAIDALCAERDALGRALKALQGEAAGAIGMSAEVGP